MSPVAYFILSLCYLCNLGTAKRLPPPTGLYFQLNGSIYYPGEEILITDIGNEGYNRSNRSDPLSSLVCVTTNVNRNCCRRNDGGRAGNWYYPNGTIVVRQIYKESFYRKFYKHEVRLNRINGVLEPLGSYTCVVYDMYWGNMSNASITIGFFGSFLTSSQDMVMVGETVTFNCSIHSPTMVRKWNFTLISPQKEALSSNIPGVIVEDSQETFRLYTISLVQISHAGLYKCKVVGAHTSSKTLKVKLQPPLSIVVLPLVQPVYATSTRSVVCYVLLQDSTELDLYLNVSVIPPLNSSQSIQTRQFKVEERLLHEVMFTMSYLKLSDSGEYTCSVQVLSENEHLYKSEIKHQRFHVPVTAVPEIKVKVSTVHKEILGGLYILACSHRSSNPRFDYDSTIVWYHNEVKISGHQSTTLVIPSLSISHVGNYSCEVKATSMSVNTTIYATSSAHEVILPAPTPSVVLTVTPSIVFRGTSPQFTCTVTYSQSITISLAVFMELRGPANLELKQRAINYSNVFTIANVSSGHSGWYSCNAVTGGPSLITTSAVASNSIYVSIVGPPSTPTIHNISALPTNITFSWTSSPDDIINYFYLNYSYTIRSCSSYSGSDDFIISDNMRNTNVVTHEDGEYSIYLYAVNTAGYSLPASFVRNTPSIAPSSGPANLRTTVISTTSVTIAWDSVPCLDRNTNITGYDVNYRSFYSNNTHNYITQQQFIATNLYPGTLYVFNVIPLQKMDKRPYFGRAHSRIEVKTPPSTELGFFPRASSSLLPNNSIFQSNRMTGFPLACITNLPDCCTYPFSFQNKGVWILPNKSPVPQRGNTNPWLYQDRHSSSVTLYRNSRFADFPDGVFTCNIPDLMGTTRNLYIMISKNISNIVISSLDYSRRVNTLTCISSGRPVGSYQWLKDGKIIENSNVAYRQTQILSDRTTAAYKHILMSDTKSNFQGTFTCIVKDGYKIAVRKTVMLNNCPPGQYGAVAFDGSIVCVQCPANSMSVSEGSNECGCLQGYYRNNLEDAHFPCTRPPSNCHSLRVHMEPGRSDATLHWTRPTITGRHDLYYNVYVSTTSNLDNSFTKHNAYPIASDLATVEYTLSGLIPNTSYKVKVSANNGVSGSDKESDRMCEVTWNTTR